MGNDESLRHHQLAKCVMCIIFVKTDRNCQSYPLSPGRRMALLERVHCPGVGVNPLTELLLAMIRPIVGKKLAGSDSIDLL